MRYKVFRFLARVLSVAGFNYKKLMTNYFRRKGMKIGEGCNILSDINSSEPFLISIGSRTTISNDVDLITHDASVGMVTGGKTSDLFGPISIGSNCFIGAHVIIMYGVTIPDNTIVASGSVVTKSFIYEPAGIIVGGYLQRRLVHGSRLKKRQKIEN